MELSLQVQQKQILSQKMQQSVEILQMNAVTLSEYIREFAEENPLVEWNEEKEPVQQENTELLQKLEWLEETDEQNRSLYRMEHEQEEKERETNAFGRKEGQSLREFLLFQINIQKIPAGHKAVLRFLAESTAESGYLEKDAIEMMMEKYPMKKIHCRKNSGAVSSLGALRCGGKKFAGVSAHSAEAEKRLCSFHEDHKKLSG